MLDIKFVRENPDAVKENIKKKFQDAKLPLVDEVIEKDAKYRACLKEVEALKAARNKLSKANGPLFGQLKKCTDEAQKAELQAQIDANNAAVKADADKMAELEKEEETLSARIQEIMYTIPQMIDPSVPIGPDDTYNVEAQRFGEPVVPDFPIPYHTEIMESFDGIDMDAAGRVAGNGFYYLLGNIARLHEAVLAYARDFMINKGFTYVIPPFMMHGNVVQGVMSFPEMDAMMYKIEGEDLYLIGTSEHTMIGRFIDQTLDEATLPLTLTSYSPCFRKEKGAHGIEERDTYVEMARQICAEYGCKKVASVVRNISCVERSIWMGMLYDAESGEHWFSPAHDVHVLEGVAAGDAFNAGLVHALINDFAPQDAVNYAIAASILKLTIKGDSNLVTADEIAAVASAADGGTRVAR